MKLKAYNIITDAIERGLIAGVNQAFKHVDNPSAEHIIGVAHNAILLELDSIIDWELGNDNDVS